MTAVSNAVMPASATYSALDGVAMVVRRLAKMVAVAESAATTRWRDAPKSANATSGRKPV
jgi:hypothetical protein